MTTKMFYDEIMTEICEELSLPTDSIKNMVSKIDNLEFHINFIIAIRKRARTSLVVKKNTNDEYALHEKYAKINEFIINRAKTANTIAQVYYHYLELKEVGLSQIVYKEIIKRET
ncbi:Hypothetical protein PACV_219 [Pacmanvirus A23]|uniref:Hypothetical protein n=1 Tax=Pacmanvirus A23 TaxID=1932881 RepID=UPI000A094918|nr:Hypothetical protein B9W72_gp217 [Pacmanvirus A23]SIP85934.1 Hypothetical protein PACV_219 [Pacmanvirus A23]